MIQIFFSNLPYTNTSKLLFDGESFIYNKKKIIYSIYSYFKFATLFFMEKKKRSAMTRLPVTTYPLYTCTKALAIPDKQSFWKF